MKRRSLLGSGLLGAIAIGRGLFAQISVAQEAEALPPQTLFTNVNVFNGTDNKLYRDHNVLVEGNLIKAVSDSKIEVNAAATVIDVAS